MLTPAHRRFLISELIKGIEVIGPEYEAFGTRLVDYLVKNKMRHRGLNSHGHPVGHTVDSVSESGDIAAEYSAEHGYFDGGFTKIFKDLRHSHESHHQATRILLLSSQECGPKVHTRLVNLQSRIKRWMGIDLEVYDARRQAEFIVDHLLPNDTAIDALSPYVRPMKSIRTEFASTNLMPQLGSKYMRRPTVETELVRLIRSERFAALAGMSGTGKSETAVAVSYDLFANFEMMIWVSATEVQALTDLQGLEIERRGHRINLLHLLRERSCLVILDDIRVNLSADDFKQYCGMKSAILITRQSASERDVRMPLLLRDEARALLEDGQASPCPDEVFDIAWKTVGGHPLALRLMNAGVRVGSWDELSGDCAAIGHYADADRPQRLADRVLGRLKTLLEKELSFFAWCRSGRADRSFARRVLSSVGLRKLDNACLLVADRNDIVRIHDIVHSALSALDVPVASYRTAFDNELDSYVEELAFGSHSALSFLSFCQVHRAQLESLLRCDPSRSSCLYCLAHAWSDKEVDRTLVGDPIARANAAASIGAPRDMDVSAVCEAIEAIYRKVKHDSGLDAARIELERFLDVFMTLASAAGVSADARRTALHHRAKALRNLARYDEAIVVCESLLSESARPATKLLLARLLIFDQGAIERAKNFLFDLLEDAKASPSTAEISVTLAAIETLGRSQLKQWFREALTRFGDLVADYIVESAARGFDQAFVAFASIGRELRYYNQALFVSVFEQLPRRTPEEARDDKERAAWGHILLAASEAVALNRPKELAAEALHFYESLEKPDSFTLQQRGHALVLLDRFEEAAEILRSTVNLQPNPWNRYWLSKALLGLRDVPSALALIDEAIAEPKARSFRAAMYEHRWEIRKLRGDPDAFEDLVLAHGLCEDSKHKASLAAKLAGARAQGGK